MDKTFFERNDTEVTKLMCKILLWMTLIFPALFLLSMLNIFSVTVLSLLRVLPFGLLCTISPTVLLKLKVNGNFLKNYSIFSVAFLIAIMASNSHIGIYMTYCLALALSCLYFDNRLTKRAAIVGYLLLVVAVFMRSGNVDLVGATRMKWFLAYTMGYTIEYIAMSLVFISLANRAKKMLVNLHNTEQVQEILAHCGSASMSLSKLMIKLKQSIDDTVDTNGKIKNVTTQTRQGCEHNLNKANQTSTSIQKLDSNIHDITLQMQALTEITNTSYEKTKNYIDVINHSVSSMNEIQQSSDSIQAQILAVEKCNAQINDFANTIASIAARTNILALNASIEAARAGENGRGFSVVATQVGQLSSAASNATINIKQQLDQMNDSVNKAREAILHNAEMVSSGLHDISNARDEAGTLLNLQDASNQKVVAVEENLTKNENYQNEVSTMAVDMSEVTQLSLDHVGDILDSLESQTDVASHMQTVFEEVQTISDQLLEISKQTASGEA